ncbi:MAG: PepSY domain-containing protein [Methanobacterium sp.]|nr:PepSY domain-containing protein [Methanobacterium sp.]
MVNTKILLSVAIVLIIGIAAASVQMTSNSPSLWSFTTPQDTTTDQSQNTQSEQVQSGVQDGTSSVSGQNGAGGDKVKISITKAKSIAQNSIEQAGVKAGTPKLTTMNGEQVYVVPVIDEKTGDRTGEIWIDAQTGEVIGGAGGAP